MKTFKKMFGGIALILMLCVVVALTPAKSVFAGINPPNGRSYYKSTGELMEWTDDLEEYRDFGATYYEVNHKDDSDPVTPNPSKKSYTNSKGVVYLWDPVTEEYKAEGKAVSNSSGASKNANSDVALLHKDDVAEYFSDEGNDVFGGVTDIVKQMGTSVNKLILAISVFVGVVGIAVTGIHLGLASTPADAEAAKKKLVRMIGGVVIVVAAEALVMLIVGIANSISSSLVK